LFFRKIPCTFALFIISLNKNKTQVMKKHLLLSFIGLFSMGQVFSQSLDTVSVGAGYANQTWYNLGTKEKYSQPLANWDLAFEISGFSASILINSANGLELYQVPSRTASESNYLSLDTIGISNWVKLYNSDTSWNNGAFNQHISANPFDLGWGIYNMNTHIITGDSLYIIKLADGTYRKLWMINLASGTYNFRFANLDGTDDTQASISKSNFVGKNFGYYSILQKTSLDREQTAKKFDLIFTKYTAFIPTPYSVTGIQLNKGIKAIKADGIDVQTVQPNGYSYSSKINTIGYDWKRFDFSLGYVIQDSLAFFIKSDSLTIYKLVLTDFGGAANGNFMFNTEKLSTSGIFDIDKSLMATFSIYPNPTNGTKTFIMFDVEEATELKLKINNLNGQILYSNSIPVEEGFNKYELVDLNIPQGTYILSVQLGTSVSYQKFIITNTF
jgi:hypothetical protein